MIYVVITVGVIICFWLLLDLLSDHTPSPGPLNRVLHDSRFKKGS